MAIESFVVPLLQTSKLNNMNIETEQLLGTLEVLCQSDDVPFFWETATEGEFTLWHLMQSEGFVTQTDLEPAFEHWQNMEKWGAPTDLANYEYAPPRSERKNTDWNDAIALQRHHLYQRLHHLCKTKLTHLSAYILKTPHQSLEWDHPGFWVPIVIGELERDRYLCLCATVPDQMGLCQRTQPPAPIRLETTSPFVPHLETILKDLPSIELYGYYHGGYNYSYQHQLFYAIAQTQNIAIESTLQSAGMVFKQSAAQSRSGFMNQCLSDLTEYYLSFWDIGYHYEVGRTPANDWIGHRSIAEFEYNP